jgi:hypothetical protein
VAYTPVIIYEYVPLKDKRSEYLTGKGVVVVVVVVVGQPVPPSLYHSKYLEC